MPSPQTQSRYDVFLSHHSSDKPHVETLAARLEDEAKLKPFLDKWRLTPGAPWQEELEAALDQSATCAVFMGASGLGACAIRIFASSPCFYQERSRKMKGHCRVFCAA